MDPIHRIAAYLKRHQSPRLQMFLILLVTGLVGAAVSYLLLHLGLVQMWLRYPLAALLAYGTFLGLIRSWAARQIAGLDPTQLESFKTRESESKEPPSARKSGGAKFRLTDAIDFIPSPDDEGILVFALVLTILVILITAIVVAPVILAEILLDGLLVAGLWRRFSRRGVSTVRGALQATVIPAVMVILCLGLIGFMLQFMDPTVDSIGDLFRGDHAR